MSLTPPNTEVDLISTFKSSGIKIVTPPNTAVASITAPSLTLALVRSIVIPPNIAFTLVPLKSLPSNFIVCPPKQAQYSLSSVSLDPFYHYY